MDLGETTPIGFIPVLLGAAYADTSKNNNKKPDSKGLVGLDSRHRFKLALAVFVRDFSLAPASWG